ncbi:MULTISPECIES: hypothetical protein [Serratia]|uniref:hypothetical protein n=1 Tax=Serratia TaxID=613 RepID=UPI0008A9C5F1|nr:hypothetical protein [Serratia marcescens]APS35567.1 hypothetical protein RN42_17750 [Serratia marcescens]MBN5203660.1 hypothetical protein [Serratia marcescens]OHT35489.1 hypothetical protein BGV45_08050 [Serratia marcescens]OHT37210.1 hypothetical protein BGV46_08045 [Serratia marcescens]
MGKLIELKAAAVKYSAALNAHRENPTDKGALYAWDEATTEFSRVVGHNELEIIIALLDELEAKDKTLELEREKSRRVMSENYQQAQRIAELEAMLAQPVNHGYKLVPVEPTTKQWAAGVKAMDSGIDKVTLVYKAMLETAPTQGKEHE